MADPLHELLAAGAVPTASLPPTSRYAEAGVDPGDPDQGTPPFFRRRFCPLPDRLALMEEAAVVEGDRRDLLAARHLGDPELWWRLADANAVLDPRGLTEPIGRRLRVTLPEGVQGPSDA